MEEFPEAVSAAFEAWWGTRLKSKDRKFSVIEEAFLAGWRAAVAAREREREPAAVS